MDCDDEDDDIRNSAKYVEFHGYNLPTSARECVTLIAGKIENLKMQNTMKSKRTRQAKALASALAITRKEVKTTATAETKDPDNKETEDSLDSIYLAALAKPYSDNSEDEGTKRMGARRSPTS